MHDPIPIRRKAWEARLAYYDRALLDYIEWIQGTMSSMKVDGFSEAVEHLTTALLKIEDAWSIVALENSSLMIASNLQGEPGGTEGGMKKPQEKVILKNPRMAGEQTNISSPERPPRPMGRL